MKLRDRAYECFTERLLSREIKPGQFLSQRELVKVTGMPLGAIRELVPRLEADGLLKTAPQRGMQIAHVDLDLIRNAFQLRLILEQEAALNYARSASDEDLAALRSSHEQVLTEAATGITPELVERAQAVDWRFHDTLIDFLGNKIISDIYRVNSIKIRLIRQERTRLMPELLVSVIGEHMRIIEALESRDPAASAAALTRHIEGARSRALQM